MYSKSYISLKEAKEDKEKLIQLAGQELADKFFKYKDRLKVEERDLYYWLKKDVKELEARISEIENTKTGDQLERSINQKGAKYLGSGKGYDVYHITTWEASRNLGKNTRWSISVEDSPAYWSLNIEDGVKFYFFIGKSPSDKYVLALYPKLRVDYQGDLFEDKKSGNWYRISKVNYELCNSEDKLSYQDAFRLPLNLIPKKIYSDIEPVKRGGKNQEFFIDAKGKLVEAEKSISGDVIIPDSVTSIGKEAFYYCKKLTSITIPDSVRSIGSRAFYNCSELRDITIPDSVTKIGNRLFYDCSKLTSAVIGNGVKETGDETFHRCSELTNVVIGNNVTSIGNFTFAGCSGLTSIIIPDNVKSIDRGAFAYCDGLTSVTIPDNVTSIDGDAFSNCSGLTSITIGSSVTSIGYEAFFGCSELTDVIIPDSVTSIDWRAFQNCSKLTSVIIPDSVTNIGKHVFRDCSKLTIYCETKEQPEGWDEDWNPDNRPVIWGYKSKVNESLSNISEDHGTMKYEIIRGKYKKRNGTLIISNLNAEDDVEALLKTDALCKCGYIDEKGRTYENDKDFKMPTFPVIYEHLAFTNGMGKDADFIFRIKNLSNGKILFQDSLVEEDIHW